jgi:hypothetical protein
MNARLLAAAGALLVAVTACSETGADDSSTSNGPYAAEIKKAAKQARTDYERAVMSDGVITRREYDETVQRTVDCAAKRGVDVTVTTEFGLNRYEVPHDDSGVFDQCSEAYLGTIEALYTATVMNPSNEDIYTLTAQCLRESGLADSSFSDAKYKEIVTGGGQGEFVDLTNAFPFDTSDKRYVACTSNPALALTSRPDPH